MSVFDTSNISQQGGTAVSPTQDAVADNSGLIRGVGQLANGALDFMAKSDQIEAADRAQTAIGGLSNEFKNINDMVAGGRITANAARAKKNQLSLAAINAGADTKAVKGLLGIGFGQEENFVSEQVKQEDDAISAAQKDGYIYPYMSREQQVEAAQSYSDSRQQLHKLSVLQAKQTFSSGAITLEEKQQRQASQKALGEFAVAVNENKKNQLNQIVTDYTSGAQTPQDLSNSLQSLKIARAEIESQIGQIGVASDPARIKAVTVGIMAQFDVAEKLLKGEISKTAADTFSANAISFQKGLALQEFSIQKLAALEQLFPTIALSAQRNIKAINFFAQNGVGYNTRPVDVLVSPDEESAQPGLKQETKEYLEAVNDMGSKAASATGQKPQEVQQAKEGVAKQLNGILNSMGNNTTSIPQASMDVVTFLADNRYYEASKSVGSLIDPQHKAAAMEALEVNGDLVIRTITRQFEEQMVGGKPLINVAQPSIKASSSGVRVVLTPRQGVSLSLTQKNQLRDTERKFSKVIGQYVAAGAHLAGHQNYEKTFNEQYSKLFGENR